jgi:hypothetical protein
MKTVNVSHLSPPLPEFFILTRLAGPRTADLTADEKRIAGTLGINAEFDSVGNGVYGSRDDADKVAAALEAEYPGETLRTIGSNDAVFL